MFELVGVRVFSDLKINWYSQLGNLLVLYYGSMTSYTLYYYHCKDQLIYGIRCLCGVGILISVEMRESALQNHPKKFIHFDFSNYRSFSNFRNFSNSPNF